MRIKDSRFVLSAPRYELLPFPPEAPEIVIIGRSNVGKSTLINRLVGRRKLARTSGTPGQTRLFNLFEIRYGVVGNSGIEKDFLIGLIDCPGYGYSKMSKKEQSEKEDEFIHLLEHREAIKGVCILNDCRRAPGPEELALRDFAFDAGKSVFVCVTKFDTLNRREGEKALTAISLSFGLEKEDLLISGESIDPLSMWEVLVSCVTY